MLKVFTDKDKRFTETYLQFMERKFATQIFNAFTVDP